VATPLDLEAVDHELAVAAGTLGKPLHAEVKVGDFVRLHVGLHPPCRGPDSCALAGRGLDVVLGAVVAELGPRTHVEFLVHELPGRLGDRIDRGLRLIHMSSASRAYVANIGVAGKLVGVDEPLHLLNLFGEATPGVGLLHVREVGQTKGIVEGELDFGEGHRDLKTDGLCVRVVGGMGRLGARCVDDVARPDILKRLQPLRLGGVSAKCVESRHHAGVPDLGAWARWVHVPASGSHRVGFLLGGLAGKQGLQVVALGLLQVLQEAGIIQGLATAGFSAQRKQSSDDIHRGSIHRGLVLAPRPKVDEVVGELGHTGSELVGEVGEPCCLLLQHLVHDRAVDHGVLGGIGTHGGHVGGGDSYLH